MRVLALPANCNDRPLRTTWTRPPERVGTGRQCVTRRLPRWRASLARRLTLIAAAGAACFALPALAPFIPVAAVALLGAGACGDTVLITSYLLVDSMVTGDTQMEAGAWVNTAYNLGVGAGSAVAGVVLDRSGAAAVFALAAGTAGAGTLAAVACGRGITRTTPPSLRGGSGADEDDPTEPEVLQWPVN
ncbi:hypothetical protein AB0436_05060 [Streptomyces sp. NPDC051322]|uniref:hypothetical protein n=1 Tax=Streptomyces sp. NPDC051322 TaxID=3154645 RepID=UPI00344D4AF3